MAEIVELDLITRLDIPVERILRRAMERNLSKVVVLGYDEDGEEYFCSSVAEGGVVVWMLERAKLKLLRISDENEPEL